MLIYEYLINRRFPIPIWILCSILWNLADNEWQGGDEGGVGGNFSKNFQGETTEMLQVWCNWPRRKVSQTCEKSQMFNKLDHQVLLGAANRLHGRLAPFSDWGVGERPGGRHWGPLLPEGLVQSPKNNNLKVFKVGVNVKDGGKYAFLGMESREAGDAVIKALDQQVLSSRKRLWLIEMNKMVDTVVIVFLNDVDHVPTWYPILSRRWRGEKS